VSVTTLALLGIIALLVAAGIYYVIVPLWHITFRG
jgi:hypothetical protein